MSHYFHFLLMNFTFAIRVVNWGHTESLITLRWNSETQNKLHAIESRVNIINLLCLSRWDEIIIHRLRILHTYLTRGHLLLGETPPQCLTYPVELTAEHILLHCVSFTNDLDDFLCITLTYMSDLFSKVASRLFVQKLISSKKLDFIVKFKCMFSPEFQLFSLQFVSFVYLFVFIQHLHCCYMLNLSVKNTSISNRF